MSDQGRGLVAANKARTERSQARFQEAYEKPTMDEALEVWRGTSSSFWKAAKRAGLRPEARKKFGHQSLTEARMVNRADMIEDAEFLAETGEGKNGAARRLGFNSWDSLYARLSDYGRLDIADRLVRNGDRTGRVRQGSLLRTTSSTNGARLT